MPQGINLLKKKEVVPAEETQIIHLVQAGSLVLLVFYCVVIVGIFSLWFYTRQENQKVNQQIALKRQQITDLEKVESLQVLFKQRLAALKTLFTKPAPDYPRLLTYLLQFLRGGISFEGITLTEAGQVTLSGEAIDSRALSEFIQRIPQGEGDELFSQIILASLTRQEEGNYTFGLQMEVKK